MKITDLTVTLFKWENITMKSYVHDVMAARLNSDLGFMLIQTDEGIKGVLPHK